MKHMLEKQGWHALFLVGLLIAANIFIQIESVRIGSLWGIATSTWYWISIAVPVLHQVFVGLAWRAQLHSRWMTNLFGKQDFLIYSIAFNILFVSRPISQILLGISNANSLSMDWTWRILLGAALSVPFVYLAYSVLRYFGYKRALGADHFDERYRDIPFIEDGIFKYTNNGMYLFGFLIFWVISILTASKAALVAAGFSHLYIWVHYYTTEKPDMQHIYGSKNK
jgi:hypothetical protein